MDELFTSKHFLDILEAEDKIRERLTILRSAAKEDGIVITYEAVAKYVGCSISKISKWMAGDQLMGPVFKAKVLDYLDEMEGKFNVSKITE